MAGKSLQLKSVYHQKAVRRREAEAAGRWQEGGGRKKSNQAGGGRRRRKEGATAHAHAHTHTHTRTLPPHACLSEKRRERSNGDINAFEIVMKIMAAA